MPLETPKLARKDAAKALVDQFDKSLKFWTSNHPAKATNPAWEMPVVMPLAEWQAIVEAIRPLAKD